MEPNTQPKLAIFYTDGNNDVFVGDTAVKLHAKLRNAILSKYGGAEIVLDNGNAVTFNTVAIATIVFNPKAEWDEAE